MSRATNRIARALLVGALAALVWPAVGPEGGLEAQDAAAQAMQIAEGATVYANMCGRCHNPRSTVERDDRDWRTIITHMRVRGNLTGGQARRVLAFLQATNGDDTGPGMAATGGATRERAASAPATPPAGYALPALQLGFITTALGQLFPLAGGQP